LSLLLSWSNQLIARGLLRRSTLDTYEREVARYGGPLAIDLLEQVMCLDSDLCSNLLASQYAHRLLLDPLPVAVFSLDRFFSAWNYDAHQRLRWLEKRTERYNWSKEFHHERKQYCELLIPWDEPLDPWLAAQRTLLHTLLAPLEKHLPPLAAQVRELAHIGHLWVTEEDLLASLAHLHTIRFLGPGANKEQQLYAFWRHTLESIQRRSARQGRTSTYNPS
jgi:thiopeptide-type bacteriocin biosynthesis protein